MLRCACLAMMETKANSTVVAVHWPARIFQHETDHLSGELYIDKAEIRSLATNENLEDFWCDDPVPTEAAAELGFEL